MRVRTVRRKENVQGPRRNPDQPLIQRLLADAPPLEANRPNTISPERYGSKIDRGPGQRDEVIAFMLNRLDG